VSLPVLPFAHETWFDSSVHPTDWAFAAQGLTLALLTAAVLVTALVRVVATRRPGVDVPALGRLVPYMPFAVRLHVAVSLVGLLSLGVFLSPAMDLQADAAGILLGAVMVAVAVSMATGRHAREGALLLAMDSTYVEIEGYTPSEQTVAETLERVIANAPDRAPVRSANAITARSRRSSGVAVGIEAITHRT